MKAKILSLFILISTILFITYSCKEVDVLVKSTAQTTLIDSTFIASTVEATTPKVIIIEEFTGVRCINCSVGHSTAASIKTANPNRVITIAHHSTFLDPPYPFSYHNLTSTKSEAISQFLGPVNAKPTAAIDRKLFIGESSKILDLAKWSNKTNEQIALTSPVNIHLESVYNTADTSTLLTFTAHFTQAVSDPLKFTIMLNETDIVTAQLMTTGSVDTNYVHEHVMRDIVTDNEGNSLGTATITPGRVFIKQYKVKLNQEWDMDKVSVVAFIHKTGASYEILQGAEIPVK